MRNYYKNKHNIWRLTIKSQVPNEKFYEKSPPPLTNSIQMLREISEGDGESKTTKATAPLAEKMVASECFGLSRVRCAGWYSWKLYAQVQERTGWGLYVSPVVSRWYISLTSFFAAWDTAEL